MRWLECMTWVPALRKYESQGFDYIQALDLARENVALSLAHLVYSGSAAWQRQQPCLIHPCAMVQFSMEKAAIGMRTKLPWTSNEEGTHVDHTTTTAVLTVGRIVLFVAFRKRL